MLHLKRGFYFFYRRPQRPQTPQKPQRVLKPSVAYAAFEASGALNKMQFDIITIFPRILDSYINESILKRAQKKKLIKIKLHDLRKFTNDKHKNVDDKPYGGGPGMLMMVEPLYKAILKIKKPKNRKTEEPKNRRTRVILLTPTGKQFDQKTAKRLSKYDQLILVCGRYEGIDARVEKFVDEKISIGPYVLSGGELPAIIVTEATARMLHGVVGHEHGTEDETFSPDKDYIEYPQYTRPAVFKNMKVPKVLLSGNHAKIKEWRKKNSKKTSG